MKKRPGPTTEASTAQSVEFCIADPSLYERTARRAYELYQERGCVHGRDVEDWLEAERQIVAQLEVSAQPAAVSVRRRTARPTPQPVPQTGL